MRGSKFLEGDIPEVRYDLLLDQGDVAFARLSAKLVGLGNPRSEMLADGEAGGINGSAVVNLGEQTDQFVLSFFLGPANCHKSSRSLPSHRIAVAGLEFQAP